MKSARFVHCLFLLITLTSCLGDPPSPRGGDHVVSDLDLTVRRIHSSPSLSGPAPKELKFSPDSKRLTYLKAKPDNKLILDLWEYHLVSKKHQLLVDSEALLGSKPEKLSEEEKSRRERTRTRSSGIVSFDWNQQGTAILFPLSGDLYLYELAGQKVSRITKTEASETDGRFSPRGRYISYVRDQDVFVFDLQTKTEKPITFGGEGPVKNGMAEFVAQEEMGRLSGYWWSKDEKFIAFTHTDESAVKIDTRTEIYADRTVVKKQRYPYTGTANARIELFVAAVDAPQNVQSVPLGRELDIYLPRVTWHPRKPVVYYQVQSRDQKTLDLFRWDLKTKTRSEVLRETSKTWVNILGEPEFLKESDHFIWPSERTGYNHLYLYTDKGQLVRPVTKGDWVVTKLARVHESKNSLYFEGTRKSPVERHIYKTSIFRETEVEKLSDDDGTFGAVFSKDAQFYIETFSSTEIPPRVRLRKNNGEHVTWLEENKIEGSHPLATLKHQLVRYERDSFRTDDGAILYYSLLKPKNFDPQKKYPLILYVYGGPHAQLVRNRWKGNIGFLHQILASRGSLVLTVDNRGSNYRGTAFEQPLHLRLAQVEVQDQIRGLEHILQKGFVDASRVGVTGHSYGGYMTLMLMGQRPEVFKAGVAVAPVTDWSLYDTHYTERYLSTPQKNPEGYAASNVLTYASNIKGDLLVVHGMADDNVLFKNSTMLFDKLQKAGVLYDSLTYPGAKHGLYGKDTQTHYYESLIRHFALHL